MIRAASSGAITCGPAFAMLSTPRSLAASSLRGSTSVMSAASTDR